MLDDWVFINDTRERFAALVWLLVKKGVFTLEEFETNMKEWQNALQQEAEEKQ